jgi:hypothetical protein
LKAYQTHLETYVNGSGGLSLINLDATELAEVPPCFVPPVLTCQELGRLWRKEETEEENAGPSELDGDWETPGDVTLARVHAVVGAVDKEDTEHEREKARD